MATLTPGDIFTHSNNKLQMRDIFAIYSHDWDVIGEIIQNSVDAVLKRRESSEDADYIPTIEITYDLSDLSIRVRDNGSGISPEETIKVVAPSYSAKTPQGTNRGEFGVGLSYVAFSSHQFRLETCSENKCTVIEVLNGYDWTVENDNKVELKIDQEINEREAAPFTEITVKPARFPEFTSEKLIYILQRLTAIGDFWATFNGQDGPIDVTLNYINKDGQPASQKIPNKLWHPADFFDLIDHETIEYLKVKEIDEEPRNKAIPNLIRQGMVLKDKEIIDDREFAYYALFCYSEVYRNLAKAAGVVDDNNIEEEESLENEETGPQSLITPEIDIYPGIYACKKGMPLGAEVPRPPRQSTGLWQAFYIVIHSDSLQTEPGRKKLNMRDERLVQSVAKMVYRKMEKLSSYVISKTNPDAHQEAILRNVEENKREMGEKRTTNPLSKIVPNISIPAIVEPVNEQTLIGLFHELIGMGLLKGYRLLKLSGTETYDGLYDYEISANEIGQRAFNDWLGTLQAKERRVYSQDKILKDVMIVVEFKLKLESIFRDFLQKSKSTPPQAVEL